MMSLVFMYRWLLRFLRVNTKANIVYIFRDLAGIVRNNLLKGLTFVNLVNNKGRVRTLASFNDKCDSLTLHYDL